MIVSNDSIATEELEILEENEKCFTMETKLNFIRRLKRHFSVCTQILW